MKRTKLKGKKRVPLVSLTLRIPADVHAHLERESIERHWSLQRTMNLLLRHAHPLDPDNAVHLGYLKCEIKAWAQAKALAQAEEEADKLLKETKAKLLKQFA